MNESTQTDRKAFQERVVQEGQKLWKKQQEFAHLKKLKEQKEMREMLERYWPWSRPSDSRPRGLRNLRLEELFPNKDYQNAKRFVGTLDLGRPGGGAPIINKTGKKLTRTREDPQLRFQFGSKDLRRCVDNTLRYKTNRQEQQEYKEQLDKMVEEKRHKKQQEKLSEQNLERNEGWSNKDTLKQLETDKLAGMISAKSSKMTPKVIKVEPMKKNFINAGKFRKLSPLSENKDNGVELVTLLAKERKVPLRIPLTSSDVTGNKDRNAIWNRQGSGYLRELTQQMLLKEQKFQEMKAAENETMRLHFTTWDSFWGRPGHGAPKSAFKKQNLNHLLYPQPMVPIGVH